MKAKTTKLRRIKTRRNPKLVTSSERIEIRINPEIKKVLVKASKYAGSSNLSNYITNVVYNNAKHLVEEKEGILTTEMARKVFFDALDNPPAPNTHLKNGFKKYLNLVDSKTNAV